MGLIKQQFLIQVNYKSGSKERFWCNEFSVKSGYWNWESADDADKPLLLNPDNVESVWEKGVRYKFLGIVIIQSTRK